MSLVDFLKEKTGYCHEFTSNIVCRCPYCGDSKHHKNKGHLYIHKQLPIFHCVRCDTSGRLSFLLHELDCNDLKSFLSNYKDVPLTPKSKKLSATQSYLKYQKGIFKYRPHLKTNIEQKLSFLSRRHVDIDNESIAKLIVWEIGSFIRKSINILKVLDPMIVYNNMVKKILEDDRYKNDLDHNYVGFLSNNGYYIICRRINDSNNLRYIKISWNSSLYNDLLFFRYKYDNDVINTEYCTCEGIYDCIQLVNYFKYIQHPHNVVAVCGGKRYSNTYKDILLYFTDPVPKYHIYFDNDIKNRNRIVRWLQKRYNNTQIKGFEPIYGDDPYDAISYSITMKKTEPFRSIV